MIAAVVGFVALTLWFLKCYTNHGESLQVHNYIGMRLKEARKMAENRSFHIVITDSIFIVGKEPGVVLEQNPKPLSRVKEDRSIYLTITSAVADFVMLPNITGGNDDYDRFYKKITGLDVKGQVIDHRFDARLEPNTILEVIYNGDTITNQLNTGFKVPKGSMLSFIVSSREGSTVTLPDLVCKQFDAAKFIVSNYSLNIGTIVRDATVSDDAKAYIWKQEPAFEEGKTIRVGEQINLYLTQKVPDGCGE
jgi:beta-lactam-binding protein with PASTA domain